MIRPDGGRERFMENILETLRKRHLLDQTTAGNLEDFLRTPRVVYAGFDPSSDSLQAGNFVTIMTLAHFQRRGHKVIALVGGATGLIGDPSGKTRERRLLDEAQVARNLEGIRENLGRFLDFDGPDAPALLVNNFDWHREFTFVSFLREVGKHFRMGAMLSRESVRTRMESEGGMSFAEFCYPLLQAYDFLHLYDKHRCVLQVGGSDQWGNITAGVELIRRLRGGEAHGLTFPLVCDSAGNKFGKSAGNAIYLDSRKTSCYDFYQFFLRTADADVVRYLKIFTFLSDDEIEAMAEALAARPEKREAQRALADTVTRAVHGEAGLRLARRASEALFGGSLDGLGADELLGVFRDVPSASLPRGAVEGRPVWQVASAAGLCSSNGQARRLIANGGLYLNNERVPDLDRSVGPADLIEDRLLVLRSGRKSYCLARIDRGG